MVIDRAHEVSSHGTLPEAPYSPSNRPKTTDAYLAGKKKGTGAGMASIPLVQMQPSVFVANQTKDFGRRRSFRGMHPRINQTLQSLDDGICISGVVGTLRA